VNIGSNRSFITVKNDHTRSQYTPQFVYGTRLSLALFHYNLPLRGLQQPKVHGKMHLLFRTFCGASAISGNTPDINIDYLDP
jgi:hypothetical protein